MKQRQSRIHVPTRGRGFYDVTDDVRRVVTESAIATGLCVVFVRHTSASLALAAGVPMRVVSERLGHSTIGITQNLYTHVFDELSRDAADKIAALIPRRQQPTAT